MCFCACIPSYPTTLTSPCPCAVFVEQAKDILEWKHYDSVRMCACERRKRTSRHCIRTYAHSCIIPACVQACILACVSHHPCHSLALHPACCSVLLSCGLSCGSPLTVCQYAAFHSAGVASASKDDSRCFLFRPHAVCVNAARMLS